MVDKNLGGSLLLCPFSRIKVLIFPSAHDLTIVIFHYPGLTRLFFFLIKKLYMGEIDESFAVGEEMILHGFCY